MPANTSSASANCGTHLGLTNADTSMTGSRAALKRLTNAILSAVETLARSFCRPSRGPTSTTVTRRFTSLSQLDQRLVRLHDLALAAVNRLDHAVARCADGQLHLHRFDQDESIACFHRLSCRHEHADDGCRHRCGERLDHASRSRPDGFSCRLGLPKHPAVPEGPTVVAGSGDVDDFVPSGANLVPVDLDEVHARAEPHYGRHGFTRVELQGSRRDS